LPLGVPAPLTRIFSDLHFDDSSSQLRSLAQLQPLLDGTDRVIINGDALDSQVIDDGPAVIADMKTFFREHTADPVFITGNHDPDIGSLHELSLADGLVWITHGDVLFEYIAPWSGILAELRRRIDRLNAPIPPHERGRIETRLRVHRQACLKLPPEHDPRNRNVFYRLLRLARIAFPPHKPLRILNAWRTSPRLASDLAAAQRPAARFMLMGHTHYPGIWSDRGPRVFINTGSLCPPRGGLVVEIQGEELRVRRIVYRANQFHLGDTLGKFPLAATAPAP
jgi:predicted phosphodiesterase